MILCHYEPAASRATRPHAARLVPDDSASVVWSIATVHHWRDLDAGLRELRRILRAGGRRGDRTADDAGRVGGDANHGEADVFADSCRGHGLVNVPNGRAPINRKRDASAPWPPQRLTAIP